MAGLFNTNPTSSSTSSSSTNDLTNDTTISNPPSDSISDISFSPQADFLSVSSWDNKVRIYEVTPQGQSEGRAIFEHQAPVLSTRWSPDGTKVVSGGCDNAARVYDLQTGVATMVAQHENAVRSVRFVEIPNTAAPMLATASWDKTLKYWDLRQSSASGTNQQPVSTIQLPERAYTMDTAKNLLVVGTAERHICIIDLNNPTSIFRTSASPLKWQTRVVACHPNGDSFSVGSIEGRCGIQYVDASVNQASSFSFKCHRKTVTSPRNETLVYALNSMCYHPVYGSLCTAGADGGINYWDTQAKHRLKAFSDAGGIVTSTAFNRTGNIFAYAISYDWSKGYENNSPQYPTLVKFHPTNEEDVKPKPKRR